MTQALLYSISPQHMLNILNGNKTIEVRKRDLPQWAKDKLARGEKVIGYGYCTKSLPNLFYNPEYHNYVFVDGKVDELSYIYRKDLPHLNGRVVVKFRIVGSDEIRLHKHWNSEDDYDEYLQTYKLSNDELCDKTCLSNEQLEDYLTEALGYAHHLSDITPVEMELGEFYKLEPEIMYNNAEGVAFKHGGYVYNKLFKAPQSFQTVWVK